eukprot:scaffold1882_cov384-Prasinococcus_capsulatus_cf.AAC.17
MPCLRSRASARPVRGCQRGRQAGHKGAHAALAAGHSGLGAGRSRGGAGRDQPVGPQPHRGGDACLRRARQASQTSRQALGGLHSSPTAEWSRGGGGDLVARLRRRSREPAAGSGVFLGRALHASSATRARTSPNRPRCMVMERTSTVEDLLDTFWKIDPDGANSQGTGLESPKTQQQQDQLLMLQQQRAAPTSPRQHRSPHPAQHQHLAHPRYVAAGPGAHPPPHQHLPQPHQYRANPSAAMHQYNYAPHGSVYVEPPAGDPRLSSPKVEGDALHYRGEAVSFGRAGASGKGAPAPPPPQRPQQPQDPGYPLPYDRNMSLKQHHAAISRQEQALAASLSTACQMVAARGHPIGATPQWEPPEPAGKDKLSMQVLPPGGGILPPVAWSAGYQPAPGKRLIPIALHPCFPGAT